MFKKLPDFENYPILQNLKLTAFLRFYGMVLNPLVAIVSPTIVEMTPKRTVLKIPLNLVTRNHLKVMYFGALNIGAELSIAVLAFKMTRESPVRLDFLFKDFKVQFLKRAEGDVHFICEENELVAAQMEEAKHSTERINRTMKAYAIVPSKDPNERIAEFELTLSVRQRAPKK